MPRSRPFLTGLVVAAVAMLATAAPAAAHDKLVSSDPSPDQALQEAPSMVELTFSAEVLDMGAAVVVADADGTDWVSGPPAIDGPTVTAALDPGMADAGYEIRWRVVSSDGHPISGVVPFTVGEPADDSAKGAGSDGAAADAAAPEAAGPPDTGSSTQGSTRTQTAQEDEGPLRAVLVGAGGAAVAVALLVLVQLLRRRGSASGAGSSGSHPHESDDQ